MKLVGPITVLLITAALSGCGSFRNTSVVKHDLTAAQDRLTDANNLSDNNFGIRVVAYNDDGSVSIAVDEENQPRTLFPGEWVNLPLREGLQRRRLMLTEADHDQKTAKLVYEEGVETGVPILRHL